MIHLVPIVQDCPYSEDERGGIVCDADGMNSRTSQLEKGCKLWTNTCGDSCFSLAPSKEQADANG
jgi:hypothetical protein